MTTLYLDCETWNVRDIRVGTYAYAETAEPLLLSWAIDDGPVSVVEHPRVGAENTKDFLAAVAAASELVAHNVLFDRAVLSRHGLVPRDPEQWRCTMVKAFTHGYPGSLDQLSKIFQLGGEAGKLEEGKSLIHRFCKPAPKHHKAARYDASTHPEEWALFVEYARRDIIAMREIDKRLPRWNDEWSLWRLDQRINDRGFAVDLALVDAALQATAAEKAHLESVFQSLTGGLVARPSQREQFREFLQGRFGVELPNTQAATLRALDTSGLPPEAARLIEIALLLNKTSNAKYNSLAKGTCADGRFRGGLQFAGAARTRRYSGRTYQPQNLPSRGLPDDVDVWIAAAKGDAERFLFSGRTMSYASAALRGVIVAPKGKTLAVADLSNIEGRVAAWLSGETWKLDAFRQFDAGEGPDLYKVAAGRILGKAPEDVSYSERNGIGKVAELALGYAGGVGAIQNFASGKMAALLPVVEAAAPEALVEAQGNYDAWGAQRDGGETDPVEWRVSEAVKLAWRARHPGITSLWRACEDAARAAIHQPGEIFKAGAYLAFRAVSCGDVAYLLCRMPSGFVLTYCSPLVNPETGSLSYLGLNQLTRKWQRIQTYGGKFVENVSQSVARDVLCQSMPIAEAAGYEIILSVHDELVAETVNGSGEGLAEIMARNPEWAAGLPLAAEGFSADRYRK